MAKFTPAAHLICPLDQQPLALDGGSLKCLGGHSFDIAKQGYVNLLPVQKKKSKDPGDSKEMIQARQRFLQAGLYQPISDQLNQLVSQQLDASGNKSVTILDAGCGEGYYLSRLATENKLIEKTQVDQKKVELLGVDISKWGVQAATKYQLPITWIVGTNAQLPVEPGSVDLIICMFGFWQPEWFARVLKPGGKVILAESGVDHLVELREIIYKEVHRKNIPELKGIAEEGFKLIDQQQLEFRPATLNKEQVQDLLVMTPHLYRASYEGKQSAQQLEKLDLTAQVVFRVLEFNPQPDNV
ncbi:putative RNA methyltransferase [Oceanospirillum sp.]|uniref:putative RNA methyltransferase n=1 Tax=Oceanospirillum sp. TaxID=2021254 RepID=UPI003A93F708